MTDEERSEPRDRRRAEGFLGYVIIGSTSEQIDGEAENTPRAFTEVVPPMDTPVDQLH